ncbi:hypothetical protein HUJ05_005219 [Dendroctonus ponderosae]|nr:hypothetical protein HUJ05_005219 [Dendroctonus ponderosae]
MINKGFLYPNQHFAEYIKAIISDAPAKSYSQATANVLYNLNWHYLDTKNRKIFLMMLTQCQQIAVISIGPFGPMSINSVISVIKAAYSYMMVMQSYK